MRILNRYQENFKYLANHIIHTIQQIQNAARGTKLNSLLSESMGIQFGFKKIFIMWTEVNKVIAVSSIDGQVLWSHYFGEGVPEKILLRNVFERESDSKEGTQQELAVIQDNKVTFLNPFTGVVNQ